MSIDVVFFRFIFYGFFAFGSAVRTAEKNATFGPYISTVHQMRKCDIPNLPYSKAELAVLYIEHKNNVLKGNYTSIAANPNVMITIQDYYYEEGKLQPTFSFKNLSCRNTLLAALANIIGISYNKKNCTVPKGAYNFEVDYNMLDHMFMSYRQYGRMLRRVQETTRVLTIACIEFDIDVKPIKYNK